MLTKGGVALKFYAMFIASKTGKTGLTVTVDVYEDTTGTPIVSGGSATELGGGLYYYTLASGSVDASGAYIAVFKTADSSVDQQHIPALWVTDTELKNLDAAISTRLATASYTTAPDSTAIQAASAAALTAYDAATAADVAGISVPSAATVADAVWDEALAGHATAGSAGAALSAAGGAADPLLNPVPGSYASGTAGYVLGAINPANVTITSPVATDGTAINLVRGDDYANADGRALTFTGATWPTLTSGTVALKVATGATITTYSGTVTGAQACRVELTDTQTAALAPGIYNYDLEATLAGGSVVTLVQGSLRVAADVRS